MKKVEFVQNVDQKSSQASGIFCGKIQIQLISLIHINGSKCVRKYFLMRNTQYCVRDNESLEAVMPLVVSRKIGVKFLTNPGGKVY